MRETPSFGAMAFAVRTLAAFGLAACTASPAPVPPPAYDPPQKGVALGLFAEDVSFSYEPLLGEIAALGATHVALVVPIYQEHGGATGLSFHTRFSPSLRTIAETTTAAVRLGLEVTLFPIVRLSAPRTPNEWRGTLVPEDRAAWFASYGRVLEPLASLGTLFGASRLVVGSELSSLDGDLEFWRPLVTSIRTRFRGPLVYSSNWDHYQDAKLFSLVDEMGVVAYFNLREPTDPSDIPALTARWRALRVELGAFAAALGKPFVFTEVGYRSRAGASAQPWDESSGGVVDLDEQRRAFAAFREAWTLPLPPPAPATASLLRGLYIWNWYGFGGATSVGYTPRGKPAQEEIERLLLDFE